MTLMRLPLWLRFYLLLLLAASFTLFLYFFSQPSSPSLSLKGEVLLMNNSAQFFRHTLLQDYILEHVLHSREDSPARAHEPSLLFPDANDRKRYCEQKFGFSYISHWRETAEIYCDKPQNIDTATTIDNNNKKIDKAEENYSHMICHKYQPEEGATPRNLCEVRRAVLDFDRIKRLECGCTVGRYKPTFSNALELSDGAVQLECEKKEGWQFDNFGHNVLYWMEHTSTLLPSGNTSLRVGENQPSTKPGTWQTRCHKNNTILHPVYVLMRYDTTNLFHFQEDLMRAFAAFATLNISTVDAQIMLVDGIVKGPYFEVWQRAFSPRRPLLIPHRDFVKHNEEGEANIYCFEKLVYHVHGGASPLSRNLNWRTDCDHNPLMKGYRDFLLDYLDLNRIQPLKEDPITITVIERRDYENDPYLGTKEVDRKIDNHDEFVQLVREKFAECCVVRNLDFATMTFREQLEAIRKTDVLFGVHGAALAHVTFLPSSSTLIEVRLHFPILIVLFLSPPISSPPPSLPRSRFPFILVPSCFL
ncbi:hypothetical protein QOT17_000125 [Balamuthia mandrillaris]